MLRRRQQTSRRGPSRNEDVRRQDRDRASFDPPDLNSRSLYMGCTHPNRSRIGIHHVLPRVQGRRLLDRPTEGQDMAQVPVGDKDDEGRSYFTGGPVRGVWSGIIVTFLVGVGVYMALLANAGLFQALDSEAMMQRIGLAAITLGLAAGVSVGVLVAALGRVEAVLRGMAAHSG